MATDLPLVLILDENSRVGSTINIPTILSYNVIIKNSLSDLDPDECVNKRIVVLEGYMMKPDGFHDLILYKELYQLSYIYLGSNPHYLEVMKDHATTYCMDYSKLDYKMLETVYSGDPGRAESLSIPETDKISGIARLLLNDPSAGPNVKMIATALLNLISEVVALRSDSAVASARLSELEGLDHIKDLQISTLSGELSRVFSEAQVMNDYIKQYNWLMRPDVYDKVDMSKFDRPPRVLYFKEYSDFLYLNSFIKTVADAIKSHQHMPFKVVRVLDNNNSMQALRLPHYYKVFTSSYTLMELYGNDYIAVTDGYCSMLETLLTNSTNLDVLIIVDSKSHNDTIVSGGYLRYNLCRNPADIERFRLDSSTVITNFEESDMSWDYFEEYEVLNSVDRFLYLSSRPVISTIESTFKYFY